MKKHDKINIYCVFFKTGSILLAMKKEENAVGENIRRLRMRNQLKQADLAQKLNISRQSLSAYERGITLPDIYLLIEIDDFFRISLDELTGRITIH